MIYWFHIPIIVVVLYIGYLSTYRLSIYDYLSTYPHIHLSNHTMSSQQDQEDHLLRYNILIVEREIDRIDSDNIRDIFTWRGSRHITPRGYVPYSILSMLVGLSIYVLIGILFIYIAVICDSEVCYSLYTNTIKSYIVTFAIFWIVLPLIFRFEYILKPNTYMGVLILSFKLQPFNLRSHILNDLVTLVITTYILCVATITAIGGFSIMEVGILGGFVGHVSMILAGIIYILCESFIIAPFVRTRIPKWG